MISIRGVRVAFPSLSGGASCVALDGLDLDVPRGEWLAVASANGGGKTTLLRVIAGLLSPSAGKVDIRTASPPHVALVVQQPDDQFVASTVRAELAWSMDQTMEGESPSAAGLPVALDRIVAEWGLAGLLDRNPHTLSGGEKQRVALASAVLQRPDLLLLDEPDAFFSPGAARACRDVVARLHARGVTVVWATPGGDAIRWAQSVAVLGEGRCVFRGSPDVFLPWRDGGAPDVVLPPDVELARKITQKMEGATSVRAARGTEASDATDLAALAAELVEISAPSPAQTRPAGGAGTRRVRVRDESARRHVSSPCGCAVRFENVLFGYPGSLNLGPIDIDIPAGACVGITGANASGKTTLLRLAAGLERPRVGRVLRKFSVGADESADDGVTNNTRTTTDRDGKAGAGKRADTARVYLMPQHPWRLFFCETVWDEVGWGMKEARGQRRTHVREALAASGLDATTVGAQFPMDLSGGEKRRVAFAIAHRVHAPLLLLDEPTAGLDIGGAAALMRLTAKERERGTTVLVCSHDVDLLCAVCDRVVTLEDGHVASVVDTSSEDEPTDAKWARAYEPRIIELQRRMEKLGVRVKPRALVPARLVTRLTAPDA